jgi:hypothetical protein
MNLTLRDVSQVRTTNDFFNFIRGDIFSPTVNRSGLRIQSSSVEPESDSFKIPPQKQRGGEEHNVQFVRIRVVSLLEIFTHTDNHFCAVTFHKQFLKVAHF